MQRKTVGFEKDLHKMSFHMKLYSEFVMPYAPSIHSRQLQIL
jgi:hypothetical protein